MNPSIDGAQAPITLDVSAILAASTLSRWIREGHVSPDVLKRPVHLTGLGSPSRRVTGVAATTAAA